MTGRDSTIDRPLLLGGVALALAGLLLALARLDLVSREVLAPWWPLLPAGIGAYRLATSQGEARRSGALFLLVAGWLLVNTLAIGGLGWTDSWPLVPLLLGLFRIAWPAPDEDRFGGFVLAGVGAWLLLATRHVMGLELATSWPLVLFFVGASIALRAVLQASTRAARRRTS